MAGSPLRASPAIILASEAVFHPRSASYSRPKLPEFEQRLRARFQTELHRLLRDHIGRWVVIADEGILATSFDRDELFRTYYFGYERPFLILRVEPQSASSSKTEDRH